VWRKLPPQGCGERKSAPIAAPVQHDRADRSLRRSAKLSNRRTIRGSLVSYGSIASCRTELRVRWHVCTWHSTGAPATSPLRQIFEVIQTRQGCRKDATARVAVAGILGGGAPNQICVELPAKEGAYSRGSPGIAQISCARPHQGIRLMEWFVWHAMLCQPMPHFGLALDARHCDCAGAFLNLSCFCSWINKAARRHLKLLRAGYRVLQAQ
jgi:hypothetical protein